MFKWLWGRKCKIKTEKLATFRWAILNPKDKYCEDAGFILDVDYQDKSTLILKIQTGIVRII